jgi:DNA repair photolyase
MYYQEGKIRTDIVYIPKGMAGEYADLALNHYTGCTHGCIYCYGPDCPYTNNQQYFSGPNPKKDILNRVWEDVVKLSKFKNVPEILISFLGDCYQHAEVETRLTRQIISMLIEYELPFTVLTKGGSRAKRDFDLLSRYPKCSFGTSLVFTNHADADHWEPHAASIEDRIDTIQTAHAMGIKTWISMEPVIYSDQAIELVEKLHPTVDHWKVGKINHNKAAESKTDWIKFRHEIIAALQKHNADFYIKKSLTEYQPR